MNPEVLIGMLAELERIRELTLDLVEQSSTAVASCPSGRRRWGGAIGVRPTYRRAARGARQSRRRQGPARPARRRGLPLRRHPAGARLRDALIASEAVENLRRVWETVSLNVLDGPAPPNAAPTAWAELLADAVIGHGLDDSILARLRPEGFA